MKFFVYMNFMIFKRLTNKQTNILLQEKREKYAINPHSVWIKKERKKILKMPSSLFRTKNLYKAHW